MDGILIAVSAVLALSLCLTAGLYITLRLRIRGLSEKIEGFLTSGDPPLSFSVREDALAPLHNAAAEMENQLALAKWQRAEEARRSSALTADISHQLKTPLSSLRLFCEMQEGPYLSDQLGQIERMERLIHSLLRLERLCADGYSFAFETKDMRELIGEAWAGLQAVYPDRELIVSGEASIRCDEKWLREAYLNLFKNACEHTKPGGQIRVSMELRQATFFCAVEDDGGGVSQSDLPRLFERFYRAEGGDKGGAGIGLSIVREIIRRHHGDIHAANTGTGLKMQITIPVWNLAKT